MIQFWTWPAEKNSRWPAIELEDQLIQLKTHTGAYLLHKHTTNTLQVDPIFHSFKRNLNGDKQERIIESVLELQQQEVSSKHSQIPKDKSNNRETETSPTPVGFILKEHYAMLTPSSNGWNSYCKLNKAETRLVPARPLPPPLKGCQVLDTQASGLTSYFNTEQSPSLLWYS